MLPAPAWPPSTGLVIGLYTHLDTHTATLCDARGRLISHLQVATTAAAYARLLEWAQAAAAERLVA